MTDRDGYYLDRPSQAALIELLGQIPDLVDDLMIAITRQDRIAGGGPKTRNGSDEQPIPIGLHAMEAADLLHHTLTAWTNHVCEQRNYPRPRNDTLTLGRWLKQHIIAEPAPMPTALRARFFPGEDRARLTPPGSRSGSRLPIAALSHRLPGGRQECPPLQHLIERT